MEDNYLENEVLKEIEDRFEKAKRAREPKESQWYRNIAFLAGHQWLVYNKEQNKYYNPPAPSWRVRYVGNRILPIVRIAIAKMLRAKPTYTVIPATNDSEDRGAAKISEKICRYLFRKLKKTLKNFETYIWVLTCGVCWQEPYYRPFEDEIDGEIDDDICNPFCIYPDPLADKLGNERWIIKAKVRSLEYIRDMYGIDVESEKDIAVSPAEQMVKSLLGQKTSNTIENAAILKEMWEKPNKNNPKGRLVAWTKSKLLRDSELPVKALIDDKKLPFFGYQYFYIPDDYWGISMIEGLIPPQKEYNKSMSQIIEHKNNVSKGGKWLLPVECNVKKNAITSQPGEIIKYTANQGYIPKNIPPQNLPRTIYDSINFSLTDMADSSGIHEVSQARAPKGVRSGVALAQLQEQDDTQLGLTAMMLEDTMSQQGKYELQLVEEFYNKERTIKIVGNNNVEYIDDFKGSMLKGNNDVVVQIVSAYPMNKLAKQDFVLNLWRERVIDDPKKILEMLEFGQIEKAYEPDNIDETYAKIENKNILDNQYHEPQKFEAHEVHLPIHLDALKKAKMNNLNQKIIDKFLKHIELHSIMYAQQQAVMNETQGQIIGQNQEQNQGQK